MLTQNLSKEIEVRMKKTNKNYGTEKYNTPSTKLSLNGFNNRDGRRQNQ